jgi:hypothetical protein
MPTQMHRLNATMILPGPHGCPCAHADGYGHQTGRSFARLPSSTSPLEHTCQTGNRPAAPTDTRTVYINTDTLIRQLDVADRPELTRRLVHAGADTPRIARAQRSLLLGAGFHDVDIGVSALALTDPAMLPIPVAHVPRDWLAADHG